LGGGTNDVQFLLASVRREIAVLKEDRRLSTQIDGNRGGALRQHVLDLIGAAEHWLGHEPDAGAPAFSWLAFQRSLRDLMLNLRVAHAAMPWLEATQSPRINLGSLYLAEEIAEILIGTDLDLVVVPNPEYMYATQSWPFRDVIEGTIGFKPKTKNRPVVLHYPLNDSNRLLLHSIFGHELGHSAVQEAGLVTKVLAQIQDDEYELALSKAEEEIWRANPPGRTRRTLEARLRCWLEELLCDHLAIDAVGPAYLFAFAGFVMPLNYGDPLPTYPPNTVRIKLAMEQLGDRGWGSYLQKVAPNITGWLSEVGANASDALEPDYAFLRDQVIRRADLLRSASLDLAGQNAFKPEVAPEADQVAELLENLILPVGLDSPIAPRSILLGGWQQALREHDDSPEGLVAALGDSRLQDLVGKAIEMSVVVSCWENP
jgi:hypothetical protein